MSRWKAASIHLSISFVVGLIVAILLFAIWYPSPYFHAAGADELILLLVGADLTLGPLLTLIVFRSGKRGLKFDLSVIALAQAIALVYGMTVVLQSRPVFLTAVLDRFVLVSANEISDVDLANGKEDRFRTRSWTGPRLVGVAVPTDPIERSDLAFSALAGRDAQNLPKYYRDYSEVSTALLKNAKTITDLIRQKPGSADEVNRWLRSSGCSTEKVVWLPLEARKEDMVMLVDKDSKGLLGALAIDPW
jgi:hypothetical protein